MSLGLFIISLLLGLIFFVASSQYIKKLVYVDINNEEDCNLNLNKDLSDKNFKDGSSCHVWHGTQCRKGLFDQKTRECISKGSYVPLILFILSVLFFLISLISLISLFLY